MNIVCGSWFQDTRQGGDCYRVDEVHAEQCMVSLRTVRTGQERTVAIALIEKVCVSTVQPPSVPWLSNPAVPAKR